jgi:TRAP-type mannitol/chloroaromatic compound transport system permease large subunit
VDARHKAGHDAFRYRVLFHSLHPDRKKNPACPGIKRDAHHDAFPQQAASKRRWLFVGSALFSAVFAILGGQALLEHWVLSLNMTPVQFMILSQAIIFVLGWPLEWTEIIIIFVPIFLPMLKHFGIDPILWGTLVFVNLQAAFLSPPVAMSAFYLKGVAPKHVTLNQIFAGMMPYMLIVILCMVIMYLWPGMTLWLPAYLYGS